MPPQVRVAPPADARHRERAARQQQSDAERVAYIDRKLGAVYFDLTHPLSYSSVAALTKYAKTLDISRQEVSDWLTRQDAYTLFRPARKTIPVNHYSVRGLDELWESDMTLDLAKFAAENDSYKYFVVIIDCLSREVFVYKMYTKTGREMAQVFTHLFESTGRSPKMIQTDHGKEYESSLVQNVFRKYGVRYRSIENTGHARFAERVQQTLKTPLWRAMWHNNTNRWVDFLDKIVQTYNSKVHSATGMRPCDVTPAHAYDIWSKLYLRHSQSASAASRRHLPARAPLRVGDYCRVSLVKSIMEKGYAQRWSQQIYKIAERLPFTPFPMYTLEDLQQRRLKGNFYREELLRVPSPTHFRVEAILQRRRRRRGGGFEVLCKWQDYDDSFNSWEPESEILGR